MRRVARGLMLGVLGLALAGGAAAQVIETTPLGPDTGTGTAGTGTTGTFGQPFTDGILQPPAPSAPPQIIDPNAPPGSTLPSTLPQAIAPPEVYVEARGGRVRVLDKLTAQTMDLDLKLGVKQEVEQLQLVMTDCRYPQDNPPSDAYAHLVITVAGATKPLFDAWMIASAPALSALDHPRYDVWVLGCDLPPGAASTNSGSGSGG